ncbi:hypothetical protein SAMN05192534_11460 [Alteribacillus persepolensis]|uniref:Uncharacterized protein n=1 Tax=Alteribacillus persepolensis TaxID=568899 RepID=A0A1G8G6Q9_9BACI|nr:hypothetical protein [Alteribacillus persepolensis]SDH89980.1 hypothetical protein SAMN05192534_11460 [Alteribacillus persepolensis]
MAFIIVDDMQVPAKKFETMHEAKSEAVDHEMVVEDDEGNYWVIDEENFPKIEAYGYRRMTN